MLAIGLAVALAASAGLKGGRTLLPRAAGLFGRDSAPAEFPDRDAIDGDSGAMMIVLFFVGLGIAAYGGYALVRALLPLT